MNGNIKHKVSSEKILIMMYGWREWCLSSSTPTTSFASCVWRTQFYSSIVCRHLFRETTTHHHLHQKCATLCVASNCFVENHLTFFWFSNSDDLLLIPHCIFLCNFFPHNFFIGVYSVALRVWVTVARFLSSWYSHSSSYANDCCFFFFLVEKVTRSTRGQFIAWNKRNTDVMMSVSLFIFMSEKNNEPPSHRQWPASSRHHILPPEATWAASPRVYYLPNT